jgi:hypothetical protein
MFAKITKRSFGIGSGASFAFTTPTSLDWKRFSGLEKLVGMGKKEA